MYINMKLNSIEYASFDLFVFNAVSHQKLVLLAISK